MTTFMTPLERLKIKEKENAVLKDKVTELTLCIETYRNQIEAVYLALREMTAQLKKAGKIKPSVSFTEWKEARI